MQGLVAILGGFVIFLAVLLAGSALIPLALAYVALRVRDARNPEPDLQLGAKTAYHLIHTIGILMVLTGLTVSMVDLMSGTIAVKQPAQQQIGFPGRVAPPAQNDEGFNAAQRTAAALVAVGTLFALLFWAMLLSTNDRKIKAVRRVFVGGRMTLCLLVTMATVAALTTVLIQKEPDDQATESLVAILLVWFPGAVVHMVLFQAASREARTRHLREGDEEAWTPPR